jgi:dipeptidyl aminopeptidase/acylaminoacyl peptidase
MSRPRLVPFALLVLASCAPASASAAPANGPVAFATSDSIFLQPLDGPEITRADRVGANVIAASRDGSLLAFDSGGIGRTKLSVAKTAGGPVRMVDLEGISIHSLDISPDNTMLAITAFRDSDSIAGHIYPYLVRIDGRKLRALKTKARFAYDMRFTRDGKSVLYTAPSQKRDDSSDCTASVRRIRIDATRDTSVYRGTGGDRPCPLDISLSPGGTSLAMTALTSGEEPAGPGPPPGVWRLSLTPRPGKPRLLADQARSPAWSPAGDQIAYTATGGDPRFPGAGPTGIYRIGKGGGTPVRLSTRSAGSMVWLPGAG